MQFDPSSRAGRSSGVGSDDLAIEDKGKAKQTFQTPSNNTHNVTLLPNNQHTSPPSNNALLFEPARTNQAQAPTTIRRAPPQRPKAWRRALSGVGRGLKSFFWRKSFGVGFAGGAAAAIGLGVTHSLGFKIGGTVGATLGGLLAGSASLGLGTPAGAAVGYAVGAAVGVGIAAGAGAIGRGIGRLATMAKSAYRNGKINKLDGNYEKRIKTIANPKNKDTWLGKQFAAFAARPMVDFADGVRLYQASFDVDRNRSDFRAKATAFLQEATRREDALDYGGRTKPTDVYNISYHLRRKAQRASQMDDEQLETLVNDIRSDQANMISDATHKSGFLAHLKNNLEA